MEVGVEEVKKKIDAKEDFILLDVRENFETKICRIENSLHIPMRQVLNKLSELPKNKEIVVYCHSGERSRFIAQLLASHGFRSKNLAGGIDAWAERIDPDMERY